MTKDDHQTNKARLRDLYIWLDGYDDIFSDFDPRSYSQRTLSEDFLTELKRMYRETLDKRFEVRILVPKKLRDSRVESRIKRRLSDSFRQEMKYFSASVLERQKIGFAFIIAGLAVLSFHTFMLFSYMDDMWVELVGLLLVPAGWFGVWEGIGKVVGEPAIDRERREFLQKFINCRYVFENIEDRVREVLEK